MKVFHIIVCICIIIPMAMATMVVIKNNNNVEPLSKDGINTQEVIDYMSELRNNYPKPENFDLVVREMSSKYIDICNMNKSYYIQPDFYEESWEAGKAFYESHDYTRWAIHGHGGYPADTYLTMNNPNVESWVSFCVLYRTGWGIETWQGIKLVPDDNKYFNVEISPDEFLLTPTFPVLSDDWVRKLTINVSVNEVPPADTYVIPVNAQPPSQENAKEWFWVAFDKNVSAETQSMIDECRKNTDSEQCEEWIKVGRNNKYINSGGFDVGNRLTVTIKVN